MLELAAANKRDCYWKLSRAIEALVLQAATEYDALALNAHLLNPAIRLYIRAGFRVAGKGRGWFGVAMSRDLRGDAR